MNPPVGKIDIEETAKENLSDLALVEQELFAATFDSGKDHSKIQAVLGRGGTVYRGISSLWLSASENDHWKACTQVCTHSKV